MGYVIAIIVVLLLVAAGVTFFVLNATKKSGRAEPEDPSAEGSPAGIAAPDDSPLGDTTEHAGEHSEGQTTDDPERGDNSGTDEAKPRVGDPGPEAKQDTPSAPQPQSERLADRSS
jgi:hypothetical protein